MTQIYLRQAQLADRDTIMQIIADAKAAMKKAGSPQWQDGHPNATMITEDITKKIGWVLVIEQQIAGYVAMQLTPIRPTSILKMASGRSRISPTPPSTG